MKCRNPPIVFTRIRSPSAKSTSTRIRSHFPSRKHSGKIRGTGTFRAQDLSFPRTNSPYGELSFQRLSFPRLSLELSFPGPFVLGNFHSWGTKIPANFRSLDLLFWGTFVPRTFRSQELSFVRLFYKALAMNADSYSNCQNLFRSRPSSVRFPKINWV